MSLPAMAGSFPDVPADHESFKAIEYLDEHDIVGGYPDGTFQPDKLVNRAEAVKIIVGGLGLDHDGNYSEEFPDVPDNEWFFEYVMAAYEKGIISGYTNGKFKPGDDVNLAETLKILILAADQDLPEEVTEDPYADVEIEDWYSAHAEYARDHNLIFADDYGNINAGDQMTRAAIAEVIYRMMIIIENDGDPYPIENEWDYYDSSELPFEIKYDHAGWELIKNNTEAVFFHPDKEFLQSSPNRIYPNTGVVRVSLDDNDSKASKGTYFSNIKTVFSGADFTEFSVDGYNALEVLDSDKRMVDWYIYIDDGKVLQVYTEFGSGALSYQLQNFIGAMLSTLKVTDLKTSGDYSDVLSDIFEGVLVEGQGMSLLNKLPGKSIIETDAIGIGTGPIDYYYSEDANYTFKYERESDVILDSREGETTAF